MAKRQKSAMIVSTLKDAVDLINNNTNVFDAAIRKLEKSNRHLRVLSVIAVGYALYSAAECRKQDEKLYQLSIRVQKLENKGE